MLEPGFILDIRSLRPGSPWSTTGGASAGFDGVAGPGWGLVMRRAKHHASGLVTRADGIHCAWVGYLENAQELTARLPAIADASVGEILSAAYREWGVAFAREVIGELAFALIDTRSGGAVVGRGDLGTRRLVGNAAPERWVVASSVALLIDALGTPPNLDPQGLAEFVQCGGLISSGRTVYSGVRDVPAAHTIVRAPDGQRRMFRHWCPTWRPAVQRSADDLDAELRERLCTSVSAAMRVDGTIGVDVSGGLDSSTVAAIATPIAAASRKEVVAYSIVHTPGSARDGSPYQVALCSALGLSRITFDADRHTDFDHFNVDALAEPSSQILQGSRVSAGQAPLEQRNVAVQLSGLGGDQVFCGDGFPPVHLASLLRGASLRHWAGELRRWIGRGDRSAFDLVWRYTRAPALAHGGGVEVRAPSWVRAGTRARIAEIRREALSRERLLSDPAAECHWREMVDIAACAYRSRTSYEMRYPLMSRSIVEFALNLPWHHKIDAAQDRVIQRRAMRGRIPELIRLRPDKGCVLGRSLEGLRTNWPLVRRFAGGERLAAAGLVEPGEFGAALTRWRHGLVGDSFAYLIGGLTLEAWLRLRDEVPRLADPMAQAVRGEP